MHLKPRVKHKTERLPRPKRMTICLGMLAQDGIVIAADAEESDTYFKRSQQKILEFRSGMQPGNNPRPTFACAFTGAGDAGYLDALFYRIIKKFPVDKVNTQEFEELIAAEVKDFHEQHLFPLAVCPDPPEIQILIGAYAQWSTLMLVSHGSTVRRGFPYVAVGAGAHFALSLINDLSGLGIKDIKHTELLAAYVLAATKDRVEHCGKHTVMVSLHNAKTETLEGGSSQLVTPPQLMTHVPSRTLQRWEDSFKFQWAPQQTDQIAELIEQEIAEDARLSTSRKSKGRR
jgi:20S proteasome alpha/beta subunit